MQRKTRESGFFLGIIFKAVTLVLWIAGLGSCLSWTELCQSNGEGVQFSKPTPELLVADTDFLKLHVIFVHPKSSEVSLANLVINNPLVEVFHRIAKGA